MRVGWWVISRRRAPHPFAQKRRLCRRALKPSPNGRGDWRNTLTDSKLIDEWIARLIDAVEAAGPQRIELEGKTPMIVLPLDTYRAIAGYRPSFIDMLRDFGVPDSELTGEQAPFNVARQPVPHKY